MKLNPTSTYPFSTWWRVLPQDVIELILKWLACIDPMQLYLLDRLLITHKPSNAVWELAFKTKYPRLSGLMKQTIEWKSCFQTAITRQNTWDDTILPVHRLWSTEKALCLLHEIYLPHALKTKTYSRLCMQDVCFVKSQIYQDKWMGVTMLHQGLSSDAVDARNIYRCTTMVLSLLPTRVELVTAVAHCVQPALGMFWEIGLVDPSRNILVLHLMRNFVSVAVLVCHLYHPPTIAKNKVGIHGRGRPIPDGLVNRIEFPSTTLITTSMTTYPPLAPCPSCFDPASQRQDCILILGTDEANGEGFLLVYDYKRNTFILMRRFGPSTVYFVQSGEPHLPVVITGHYGFVTLWDFETGNPLLSCPHPHIPVACYWLDVPQSPQLVTLSDTLTFNGCHACFWDVVTVYHSKAHTSGTVEGFYSTSCLEWIHPSDSVQQQYPCPTYDKEQEIHVIPASFQHTTRDAMTVPLQLHQFISTPSEPTIAFACYYPHLIILTRCGTVKIVNIDTQTVDCSWEFDEDEADVRTQHRKMCEYLDIEQFVTDPYSMYLGSKAFWLFVQGGHVAQKYLDVDPRCLY